MLLTRTQIPWQAELEFLELSFPRPALPESAVARPEPAPRALLSLRSAGSMRYLAEAPNPDRETFFRARGFGAGRLVGTELHHTRRVRFIDGGAGPGAAPVQGFELDAAHLEGVDLGDGGPDGAAGRDGLVIGPGAQAAALVPVITVADCMPIWLFDFRSGAYGVLHSGWKGTGILAVALEGLRERYGSQPRDVSVILGPAIGACCYGVPAERAAYFRAEFGEESVLQDEGRGFRLDLRKANLRLAERLGLGAALSVEACTACSPILGSYRREGPGAFTRMAAACGRV